MLDKQKLQISINNALNEVLKIDKNSISQLTGDQLTKKINEIISQHLSNAIHDYIKDIEINIENVKINAGIPVKIEQNGIFLIGNTTDMGTQANGSGTGKLKT